MNKSAFARDLELAPNTVYRMEAGEMAPGTSVLLRWAKRCGVGLDAMLAGVPPDESTPADAWGRSLAEVDELNTSVDPKPEVAA